MNQLTINNINKLDITKPNEFAAFVAQAKALQNVLESAWGAVEQQMLTGNIAQLKGDWGSISFQDAELLVVSDASQLDTAITKPSLDTKKVRAYRDLMGELPAGVTTKNITKFVKRIKG
jgi:hypothetical protein